MDITTELDRVRDTLISWVRQSRADELSPSDAYDFGLIVSSWDELSEETKISELELVLTKMRASYPYESRDLLFQIGRFHAKPQTRTDSPWASGSDPA